jgi:hypothetical protein
MHNGGWWFPLDERVPIQAPPRQRMPRQQKQPQNFAGLLARWQGKFRGELDLLAQELGIDRICLEELGTVYCEQHKAFAFPMSYPSGEVVGIRLRQGPRKWAIKGSKAALFIPFDAIRRLPLDPLVITEGPTDTASALHLGFFAVGRPACIGQEEMVEALLRETAVKNVFLIYDNDEPGVRGADRLLQRHLRAARVTRIVPPAKDLREFIGIGGTREVLLSLARGTVRVG